MTTKAWFLTSQTGDLSGLELQDRELPKQLGDHEVLVLMNAASLNYRDIVIAEGLMGAKSRPGVIIGSDGAGSVVRVGKSVTSVKPKDNVVTHMLPEKFHDPELGTIGDHDLPRIGHIMAGMGQYPDGTLTSIGIFHESCLVKYGGELSFAEACTLSCSGITAWNALVGVEGRKVKKGDWVLVQGSGGVSVAALQFAVAAGANVVATTSSDEKGERLRSLGASHIVNYRKTLEWGETAREHTPDSRGFDIIVDVAGNATIRQSLAAVRTGGHVILAGMIGGPSENVPLVSLIGTNCTVTGTLLGTRQMMRDMIAFIEEKGVKPALDDEVFPFADAKKAFEKMKAQKHFSKVIIDITQA